MYRYEREAVGGRCGTERRASAVRPLIANSRRFMTDMCSLLDRHYSRVLLSGGFNMRRLILLGVLVAAGSLSLLAAQPPAQPAGPRVIDIVKLKDNMYVLTTSTPGNPATFSGGNVAVFITDGGVTLVDTNLAGWGQAVLDKVKGV